MTNVIINDIHLTNIADSIRNKNGSSNTYKPSEMATAISEISVSEDLTNELTEQNNLITTQETTIDDIILALEGKATGGIVPEGSLDITENGEYNVYEFEKVNVNVPIPDGYIRPSGVLNITKNGEVDVTNYEKANVNVNVLNDYFSGVKTKITAYDLKGITEIRDYAFAYAPITEVEFSDSVVKIGNYAFRNTNITSVDLTGITSIGSYSFTNTPIVEVVIPSSVTSTGQRCFENCKQLKKAVVECRVLAPFAFQYDTALEEIICLLETPPTIYTSTFQGTTCPIKVRADLVEKYKSATNWSAFADRIVAYEEE